MPNAPLDSLLDRREIIRGAAVLRKVRKHRQGPVLLSSLGVVVYGSGWLFFSVRVVDALMATAVVGLLEKVIKCG